MDIKYIKDNEGNNFFPVVNEKGVVDDNGTTLESKLQQKQDEITTVTVNVDNSIGTPSGSASMSGNTLSLNFSNIKGVQGIQGIQGPQGERGPQGNTGVQVDSVASIIHSIDPTATYAAADVAGADAVQDVLAEVTELAGALGVVYDVSAKNPTAGPNNDGKWESLSALLSDANLNTLIPTAVRKGGMSLKFVQSSDNKYVQYRLMSDTFNITPANWQGVDDEPTNGSENLVKSGGVHKDYSYNYISINGILTLKNLREISKTAIGFTITDQNKWSVNTGCRYYLINVEKLIGRTIFARNYTRVGMFAFVKELPQNNANVVYADGESLHSGYSEIRTEYTIPETSKYMFVRTMSTTYNDDNFEFVLSESNLKELNNNSYKAIYEILMTTGGWTHTNRTVGQKINSTEIINPVGFPYVHKKIKVYNGDIFKVRVYGGDSTRSIIVTDDTNTITYVSQPAALYNDDLKINNDGYLYIQNELNTNTDYFCYRTASKENRGFIEKFIGLANIKQLQIGTDYTLQEGKGVSVITGQVEDFSHTYVTTDIEVTKGQLVKINNYYGSGDSFYAIAIRPKNNTKYLEGREVYRSNQEDIEYFVPYDGYIRVSVNDTGNVYKGMTINIISNTVTESIINSYKTEIIRQEIEHSTYIGNFNNNEASSGFIVAKHDYQGNENPKGYCVYHASSVTDVNPEAGNKICIVEFYLQEPSNRITHTIVSIGDTVHTSQGDITISDFVVDPSICEVSDSLIYITFRTSIDNLGKTLGMTIRKDTFDIVRADVITLDGETPILNYFNWSNGNIVKYNDRYYRSWRSDERGTLIIVSEDLYAWYTYLDLSLYAPASSSVVYDETEIAINNNVLYMSIRKGANNLVSFDMTDAEEFNNVATSENTNVTTVMHQAVRTSVAVWNNFVYVIGTTMPHSYQINGINLPRGFVSITKLDKDFHTLERYFVGIPVGCNYNLLLTYERQLLGVFLMNKQGQSQTNAVDRCGIYFTPLFSLMNI